MGFRGGADRPKPAGSHMPSPRDFSDFESALEGRRSVSLPHTGSADRRGRRRAVTGVRNSMCQRIRRDPQIAHIPVILFTTDSTNESIQQGLEVGADGYIIKGPDAIYDLQSILQSYGLIPPQSVEV